MWQGDATAITGWGVLSSHINEGPNRKTNFPGPVVAVPASYGYNQFCFKSNLVLKCAS